MGENVYSVDEDISDIIVKNDIEGVLVSPYRVDEFRNNQEIQDKIISAGAKIYMAQNAREMNSGEEDVTPEDFGNMQLREVSVEELLPRSEIRVDLKSVEELFSRMRPFGSLRRT